MAFRLATRGLANSKSALGAFYRRLRARIGAPKAITAIAYKIAKIFYRMLTAKRPYEDVGQAVYDQRFRASRLHSITRTAKDLGSSSSRSRPLVGGKSHTTRRTSVKKCRSRRKHGWCYMVLRLVRYPLERGLRVVCDSELLRADGARAAALSLEKMAGDNAVAWKKLENYWARVGNRVKQVEAAEMHLRLNYK